MFKSFKAADVVIRADYW